MGNKNKGTKVGLISITQILEIIAKELKLLIFIPLIVTIYAIINIQYFTEPIYISTSKIVSSGVSNTGVSQAAGLAAQFGISLPSNHSGPKWIYSEIIRSRPIVKKILSRRIKIEPGNDSKTLFAMLLKENKDVKENNERINHIAYEALMGMIDIDEDNSTGIITISVKSTDKLLAHQLNKIVIEELDNHQKDYNNTLTARGREFIEQRIHQTEKELNEAEESLKNFRESNRRIENSPGLLLEQQRLGREVQVLTGVFTTLKQQLETTKIEQVKESDYVIIINPPNLPFQYTTPKKREYVMLAGIFGLIFALILIFIKYYFELLLKENRREVLRIINLFWKNFTSIFSHKS